MADANWHCEGFFCKELPKSSAHISYSQHLVCLYQVIFHLPYFVAVNENRGKKRKAQNSLKWEFTDLSEILALYPVLYYPGKPFKKLFSIIVLLKINNKYINNIVYTLTCFLTFLFFATGKIIMAKGETRKPGFRNLREENWYVNTLACSGISKRHYFQAHIM